MTYKWNFWAKCGTPMVPKISFLKNSIFQLSNDVSTASADFLDPNLHPGKYLIFKSNLVYFGKCDFSVENYVKIPNFTRLYKHTQESYKDFQHGVWKPRYHTFQPDNFWVPLGYPWYPNNNMLEPVWKLTENVPTLPTNGILEINVVPQWYPKFYFWKIQYLSFPTPCQPSP